MRLIDADELTEMVWRERLDTRERIANLIARQPTIEAKPVKRGKWDRYICSECNVCADYFISGDFYFDEKPDYCPNCGAKMDIIYEDDKIRAIKVTGWDDDTRNLTDEETDIYNNRLEAEAETIDEISLL